MDIRARDADATIERKAEHDAHKLPAAKYYESHVTIDPEEGERLERFEGLCLCYGFRVAKLIKLTGAANDRDQFCTGHSKGYADLLERMAGLVCTLRQSDYVVRRYKIESVLFDSKSGDRL